MGNEEGDSPRLDMPFVGIPSFLRSPVETDLSRIDANSTTPGVNDAFTWIGASPFSNTPGQFRFGAGVAQGDINGDGITDIVIGVTGMTPQEGDFNF